MGEDDWDVVIGEIVSPFGRRGEVKVRPETDSPERFDELEEVCVGRGKAGGRVFEIEAVRHHKRAVLIKFAGIDDISAAETLRGSEVRIRESEVAPLEEDEYYVHDIIGLDVVTTEGESLGKVREIVRSPANDVYVTERAMIPAVKEFVVSIDLREKKMVVRPIEGMVRE